MPPEVLQIIQEQGEWSTPSAMVTKIQATYPQITTSQIYSAWKEFSETFWRREDAQLPSARTLLAEVSDDVDIFEPVGVPEDVEILAWAMKRIAEPLRGKVVEIGIDATCKLYLVNCGSLLTYKIDNTNSKHLELYSIMGEYDNAGFPLTYCLLSTATAIDTGKRKKAIAAWSRCLRDKYGVSPVFIHSDKDMGEIGAVQDTWEAKINLCWWHLRRAVRTRLAKSKLATSPYNVNRAIAEFIFIKRDFIPPGTGVDIDDYEGGIPDIELPPLVNDEAVATQPAALPAVPTSTSPLHLAAAAVQPPALAPSEHLSHQSPPPPLADTTNFLRIKLPLPYIASAIGRVIRGEGFRLSIAAAHLPTIEEQEELVELGGSADNQSEASVIDDDDDNEKQGRRTFCAPLYRDAIIKMMERHYCAHPSIPGCSAPSPELIKKWAVQRMYDFCERHGLPEVWVYLWENWYRAGRWELWARCAHKLIPRLKTTMILESQ
jgi:hypothetical protein